MQVSMMLYIKIKDYEKETKIVNDLLEKSGLKNKNICEFGCGTGEHDIYLTKMDYCIHGIDLSEEMVKVAIEKNCGSYEVADIRYYKSEKNMML